MLSGEEFLAIATILAGIPGPLQLTKAHARPIPARRQIRRRLDRHDDPNHVRDMTEMFTKR